MKGVQSDITAIVWIAFLLTLKTMGFLFYFLQNVNEMLRYTVIMHLNGLFIECKVLSNILHLISFTHFVIVCVEYLR